MPSASVDAIRRRLGEDVGVSSWMTVGQDRIDAFAEATDDKQFIHLDAQAAAAATPFGGTIAHGFLTLSLISAMGAEVMLLPEGMKVLINYGVDRLRFLSPVRAGKRVRGRFVLIGIEERGPGRILFRHAVTVEIDGEPKPALTADWLGLALL